VGTGQLVGIDQPGRCFADCVASILFLMFFISEFSLVILSLASVN
jgi:hypothetical protein